MASSARSSSLKFIESHGDSSMRRPYRPFCVMTCMSWQACCLNGTWPLRYQKLTAIGGQQLVSPSAEGVCIRLSLCRSGRCHLLLCGLDRIEAGEAAGCRQQVFSNLRHQLVKKRSKQRSKIKRSCRLFGQCAGQGVTKNALDRYSQQTKWHVRHRPAREGIRQAVIDAKAQRIRRAFVPCIRIPSRNDGLALFQKRRKLFAYALHIVMMFEQNGQGFLNPLRIKSVNIQQ
jgi:hypothetical protein